MLWVGAALLFSALFFMPGLLEQFETPKIEAVRVCGLGALTLALWVGRARHPKRWRPLDAAVVAWLVVEIVTTLLSRSPRVSLLGETRQREGLLTSLALTGIYFAARDAFARPERMRALLHLVLGLSSLVGLYALVQVTGHDPFHWRREAIYAGAYVRPFATLGHPNLLGVLTAAAAAIALALALAERRGRTPWLYGGAAAIALGATVLTLSRAAWLGVGAGTLVALVLALRECRAVGVPPRAWLVVAGALAVAVVAAGFAGWGGLLSQRFSELAAGGGGSGSSRIEIWRTALAAWRARPLVGQGPDLFEMMFPFFQTAEYWRLEWSGLPYHAHSIYLHTLATRGILGLLAALGWAAALTAAAIRVWRTREHAPLPGLVPAAAGALVTLAVAGAFGALGINGALLIVVISALLASAAESDPATTVTGERVKPAARRGAKSVRRGAATHDPSPRARPSRRWAARAAATAISFATLLWCFTELRASRAASAAQSFMTSAPARAVDASGYAITLEPHDDRLWRMHAETLLWLTTVDGAPAGALGDAEAAARRAVALAPLRGENHLILARALAAREAGGDSTARADAEAEFRRSFALAPMDGLNLMEYADHEAMSGRPATALTVARHAAALYPDQGEVVAVLARALMAAGERDSARTMLERSLRGAWQQPGERREAEQALERLQAMPPARPPGGLAPGGR